MSQRLEFGRGRRAAGARPQCRAIAWPPSVCRSGRANARWRRGLCVRWSRFLRRLKPRRRRVRSRRRSGRSPTGFPPRRRSSAGSRRDDKILPHTSASTPKRDSTCAVPRSVRWCDRRSHLRSGGGATPYRRVRPITCSRRPRHRGRRGRLPGNRLRPNWAGPGGRWRVHRSGRCPCRRRWWRRRLATRRL